ncbi:MAG: glycosyltransferase family 39 protein [Clostridia bacterium]|nr:glycosyltransferase family 39 protein [Clostridia bacterium]
MQFVKKYESDFDDTSFQMPKWGITAIFFGVWFVVLNVLAVVYILKSEYIYFWDNATYWDISKSIANGAMRDGFLKSLYNSISTMDYNYLAGIPTALFIKIFGPSRLVYELTLVNLYLFPSVILIYKLAKKLGKSPKITTVIVMLICPAITFMAFIGFVDIGGLLGGLLCYYLYFERDNKETKWYNYIIIGAVIVLMMLWRRWYAFFGVSFITAMLADSIINKKRWYMSMLSGVVALLIIVLFFRDFLFNILLANYGEIYSGYKFSPSVDFKLITRYFGIIYLLVLLVSTVTIAVRKKDLRPVFCWVQMITCAVIFMFMQTHGQQHLLLYIPSVVMLTVFTVRYINKEWMLIAISLLSIIDAVNVCIPYEQPQSIGEIKVYAPIPNFSMRSRKRDDVYQILDLKKRLDTVVGDGETLGVLASSFVINEDVLRNVESSLNKHIDREDYIKSLPQVDSRDTDMSVYNDIDYVLVAYPAQTHLTPDRQRVITKTVDSFMSWTGIATAFEEEYDFAVSVDGIDLKLFHRVRQIPDYEMVTHEKLCGVR